jgi:hypothetical protein
MYKMYSEIEKRKEISKYKISNWKINIWSNKIRIGLHFP